jgi:hypothetical protein
MLTLHYSPDRGIDITQTNGIGIVAQNERDTISLLAAIGWSNRDAREAVRLAKAVGKPITVTPSTKPERKTEHVTKTPPAERPARRLPSPGPAEQAMADTAAAGERDRRAIRSSEPAKPKGDTK